MASGLFPENKEEQFSEATRLPRRSRKTSGKPPCGAAPVPLGGWSRKRVQGDAHLVVLPPLTDSRAYYVIALYAETLRQHVPLVHLL